MSTYESLMEGTKFGPMINPGNAFASNLMVLLEGRADKTIKMPHGSNVPELTKVERMHFRTWINDGAKDTPVYSNKVFPILETYCLECHQPDGAGFEDSGFDMRTYDSLMKGTSFGPMIIPGDAFSSNLMVLIEGRANKEIGMPHQKTRDLSKREKHIIRAWINHGALNN